MLLDLTMITLCLFCLPYSFFYSKNVQDSEEQDLFKGVDWTTEGGANEQSKFTMKSFDSSSDEDDEANSALLELDDDEEDDMDFQTPKLHAPAKRKVSEKKALLITILSMCGKTRAGKILLMARNARNALIQTASALVIMMLVIFICFFITKLFHHHVVMKNDDRIYHTLINDFFGRHQNVSQLMNLIIACMVLVGSVLNAIYLAYGMTGLPFLLIKGTKSLEDENDEVRGSIHQVRE